MPRSVTIRDVPEPVLDELAKRARATGRSLQEYVLRHLVDWASRPEPEAWAARVEERIAREGGAELGADRIVDAVHADRKFLD